MSSTARLARLLPSTLRRAVLGTLGFRFVEDEIWLTVTVPAWIKKDRMKRFVRDLKGQGHDVRITTDGYTIRKGKGKGR